MKRPALVTDICPHCRIEVVNVEIHQWCDGPAYRVCMRCHRYWSRRGTPLTKKQVRELTREDIFKL